MGFANTWRMNRWRSAMFKTSLTVLARFQNTGVGFAMPFSIFGAISKRKRLMLSVRTTCSCWIATALVRFLRKTWSLRLETCLIAIQIPTCNIRPYWKETPMRLWHEDLINYPRPQLWGNIESAAPCVAMVGAKTCDGGLCLYSLALSSLCLSSLDYGGNGWPWLQCQSRMAGQELPWQKFAQLMKTCLRKSWTIPSIVSMMQNTMRSAH